MRVPFKAFVLADHLLTYDEGVLKDPEVFIALESVLAECQKRSYPGLKLPIKEWKQQLVLHALFAERYEEAYKYGKELKGDLGIARSYRGRVVTLSRLELLKDSKLHEVEAKIDDGTLDLENVDQLIDELSLSRMDLDTDSSKYLDELVELIRMVQAYESGEWADLMTKSKNLLPWRNPEHRGLNPKKVKLWWVTKQGFRCNSRGQKLQWRWPVSSPYILEADISNKKNKNVKKQSWCRDGLWVSQLPTWHAKSLTKFIFVDTNIGRAGMRDLDRDVVTIKSRVIRDGPNRMRLRVWEDYFDFTIDGVLVGYEF